MPITYSAQKTDPIKVFKDEDRTFAAELSGVSESGCGDFVFALTRRNRANYRRELGDGRMRIVEVFDHLVQIAALR